MTVEQQASEILAVLSDELKREHEGYRAAGERERWASGQLSLDLVSEFYPHYTKTACRVAVAALYRCSSSAIRDREYMVERVPDDLRAEYPYIGYYHWRPCVQAGDAMMDMVYQVAAFYDAHGRLPSVDSLYSWSKGLDSTPVWALRLGGLSDAAVKIEQDAKTPAPIRALMRAFHKRLGVILRVG